MNENEKKVKIFIDASIKYGEAIETGDSQKANRQSLKVRKMREQLGACGQLKLLIPYMMHESEYVRLNVASSLISVLPYDSKNVLIDLEKRKGLVGFEAKMFLREWEKGNIR